MSKFTGFHRANKSTDCTFRIAYIWRQCRVPLLLILLLISCLFLLVPVIRFFHMMSNIPDWASVRLPKDIDDYSLEQLIHTAQWLSYMPAWKRKFLIMTYQLPISLCYQYDICFYKDSDVPSPIPASSKLFLLLRVLFSVPETYERQSVRYFGSWITIPPAPERSDAVNLLWPLGYQNGDLKLKASLGDVHSDYYNGIDEYNYFHSRFPLRYCGSFDN